MILQLIVAVIGLLMYVLATNPKINEIGRILFWTGTLTFLMATHFPILGH
jgi:hypothetical protein